MKQTPTEEMLAYFEKRTKNHIHLVNFFAKEIKKRKPTWGIREFKEHDSNKFTEPLKIPYVFLTWKYHEPSYKFPAGVKEMVDSASLLHVLTNQHHPEFWDKENAKINEKDRDKPSDKVVDATTMVSLRVVEMVCDWAAVGWERDGESPRGWAKKNVNVRWKFTKQQEALIYRLIDVIEEIISEEEVPEV